MPGLGGNLDDMPLEYSPLDESSVVGIPDRLYFEEVAIWPAPRSLHQAIPNGATHYKTSAHIARKKRSVSRELRRWIAPPVYALRAPLRLHDMETD